MPFPTATTPFDKDPANPKLASQPDKGLPILCLDFDGVIHSYTSGWHGPGVANDPPVPGLCEFIEEAAKHFRIAVYSSRSHAPEGVTAMRNYLIEAFNKYFELKGMGDYDARIEASSFVYNKIYFPDYKPSALVTIDDRAMTFTGVWPKMEELLSFKPWNKQSTPAKLA